MGIRDSWTQFLFTMPSAVAVINGLLGGVTVALAVATAAHAPLLPTVLERDGVRDRDPGPPRRLPGAPLRQHAGTIEAVVPVLPGGARPRWSGAVPPTR